MPLKSSGPHLGPETVIINTNGMQLRGEAFENNEAGCSYLPMVRAEIMPCCDKAADENFDSHAPECDWRFNVLVDKDGGWIVFFDWRAVERRMIGVDETEAADEIAAMRYVLSDTDSALQRSDFVGMIDEYEDAD